MNTGKELIDANLINAVNFQLWTPDRETIDQYVKDYGLVNIADIPLDNVSKDTIYGFLSDKAKRDQVLVVLCEDQEAPIFAPENTDKATAVMGLLRDWTSLSTILVWNLSTVSTIEVNKGDFDIFSPLVALV